MKQKVHIALLMMVKNEQKRLQITLDSVENVVDSLIIFDTGSTDNTIQIIKDFSKKTGIPLNLKQGDFVNFSQSRNVSLSFADEIDNVDFLLLLDCNDEVKGGEYLREFCEKEKDVEEHIRYLCCQEWKSEKYDKYYNVRLCKPRTGCRYKGSVHEYMVDTTLKKGEKDKPVLRVGDEFIIYQDRTQDDNKSGERFERDKKLLLAEHIKDPTEPRTVFYLAQTCACLNQQEDAYYYYKLRLELPGFYEERYQSYFRIGELAEGMGHPWYDCMAWYMKAFEFDNRAEPLVKITQHYIQEAGKNQGLWALAFHFIYLCCELKYPDHCILFVDKEIYDYKRWHLLGIVGFYCGKYNEGEIGCRMALQAKNLEVDKNNLKFYTDRKVDSQPEYPSPAFHSSGIDVKTTTGKVNNKKKNKKRKNRKCK